MDAPTGTSTESIHSAAGRVPRTGLCRESGQHATQVLQPRSFLSLCSATPMKMCSQSPPILEKASFYSKQKTRRWPCARQPCTRGNPSATAPPLPSQDGPPPRKFLLWIQVLLHGSPSKHLLKKLKPERSLLLPPPAHLPRRFPPEGRSFLPTQATPGPSGTHKSPFSV